MENRFIFYRFIVKGYLFINQIGKPYENRNYYSNQKYNFHTNNVNYQHFIPAIVLIISLSHHIHATHVKMIFYTQKIGLES